MTPTQATSVFMLQNTINGIRQGILSTRAGKARTPLFMPVGTRGAVKSLSPDQVATTGAQIVLGNTYHLHLQPGEEVIEKLGGLHEFTQWKGPILTDSGGFQVFSLGHINKITEEGVTFKDPKTGDTIFLSPEKSMQIQFTLGSDIIMAFDDVVGLDDTSRKREAEAFERTHRWLERSVAEFKKLTGHMKSEDRPLLFGIAQGGLDKSLRKKSIEMVQATEVDGLAVGGLSVGETRQAMHDMLEFLAPLYDPNRPHYLMGVGDPIDMRFAIEHGIDMFDCVLPTRNARHATAWVTGDKKIHLTNLKFAEDASVIDPGCDCSTCKSGYSRGFLRHQFKVGEPLAGSLVSIHNIRYLERLCEEYRSL
jgi:queuine tRNA-ribosyltransferase